ncbi:MAG TPA: exodeoxyribonuclease VII small subunit [Dehalococcoidia bacterium]|nr:exodeoxyribonuclease VII small subunit [Dehalococcoidia bacterium]
MAKDTKRETFEQLYARLEAQVARLEQGGLPLDEAIALYEEGMTIARQCQERLDQAEMKITKLRESFATLPDRPDAIPDDSAPEYEYVDDDGLPDEDEPFP